MNPESTRATGTKSEVSGESSERALASITVASRIPEFWTDQTRLWFVQFEAAVENQRLSDAAKQNLVVTKLSKDAIQQVSDLLLAPPENRKYQTLKERLLQVFEESETKKLQKLLREMDLGEQKPSQLLRRMRDLAGGKMPNDTLKLMWQSHLPTAVRAILTVTDSENLDTLAVIADKVLENTGTNDAQIAVVNAAATAAPAGTAGSAGRPSEESEIRKIRAEVARINVRLQQLERGRPRERRDTDRRPRSVSRSSSTPGKRKTANWLCFYHFRYRENATKCVKPCNWSGEQQKSTGN
ncbi:hypothetical protein PYW08_001813 [Mythimna loreyi]|uniref:Uncharacterized protein n=1 Tax=Mythimna loreyi TaxID=667449 RepID=A0ACC2R7R4_9NEOP|nr:hypothetical protein PYW08_001813 [Mythimna loreyi]